MEEAYISGQFACEHDPGYRCTHDAGEEVRHAHKGEELERYVERREREPTRAAEQKTRLRAEYEHRREKSARRGGGVRDCAQAKAEQEDKRDDLEVPGPTISVLWVIASPPPTKPGRNQAKAPTAAPIRPARASTDMGTRPTAASVASNRRL